MDLGDVAARAEAVFRADAEVEPPMTLRAGDAVDSHAEPPAPDPALDTASDAYLETYAHFALPYLDAASWRHYLPRLIGYTLRHLDDPRSMVPEALLWSLRPPDREPPRLGSLSAAQEAVVVAVLDVLAFDERSVHQDLAMQVLEEYWAPGALYRRRPPEGTG
jgi:hypothetical protein